MDLSSSGLRRSLAAVVFTPLLILFVLTQTIGLGSRQECSEPPPLLCPDNGDCHKKSSGEALAKFLEMSLAGVEGLPRYAVVPGLEDLTFYVWDVHPKPIIMLHNSHLMWYEQSSSESHVVGLMRYLLSKRHTPSDGIVVDMGINDGFISALAAAHDYKVVGVDGQPECVRRFLLAKAVNGWSNVSVYNHIIADKKADMPVLNGVCAGGARYLAEGKPTHQFGPKARGTWTNVSGQTFVKSKELDELLPTQHVVFFHLDVEGAEISVLRSASRALRERRIHNLCWEFAPHRWNNTRESILDDIESIMQSFTCRDVISLDIRDPFRSSGIINDWRAEYTRWEEKRRIGDVWCTLKG